MPFCTNCGAEIKPDARFCPSCGTALAAAGATAETPKTSGQQQANNNGPRPDPWEQQTNSQQNQQRQYQQQAPVYTKPAAPGYDAADIEQNKYLCILCYFGILLLIPLLAKANSRYCKYHSNQGLVLLLFMIAVSVVAIIPILGWLVMLVGYIFGFVCWIIGIVNTCSGKVQPLPLIGKLNILN